MALSAVQCHNSVPKDKPYKVGDSGSLYLLVRPNGSKLWQMGYVFQGKQKTLSFGPFPDVTLLQARSKRDAARALLRDRRDPMVERQLADAPTALVPRHRGFDGLS
jgi:hypothetical protein